MKIRYTLLFIISFSILSSAQSIAWDRVNDFGKGMNLSWLENWWNGSAANNYSDYIDLNTLQERKEDVQEMYEMGIKTIRLPVVFDVWEDGIPPYTFEQIQYFATIDSFITWTKIYDLNLIIDYHHGSLTQNNFDTEKFRIASHWRQIAQRYKGTNPNRIFFELYNEPYDINANDWQTCTEVIIDSIRLEAPEHTLVIGGVNWNSISGLLDLEPFEDDNVIYTYHYYDPFIFTHQGAEWVGDPVSTVGIPFPYDANAMPPLNPLANGTWGENAYDAYDIYGTEQTMIDGIGLTKVWSDVKQLPIFCGEWGAYYKAGLENRCRHTKVVRQILEDFNIPYCYWEWDQGFSLYDGDPEIENLPDCMKEAFFDPLTLNTSDKTLSSFKVFPNPTSGIFQLKSSDLFIVDHILVQSLEGKIIKVLNPSNPYFSIDDLPEGLYYLHLMNKDNEMIGNEKIIKT